jgi:hypothetical protein
MKRPTAAVVPLTFLLGMTCLGQGLELPIVALSQFRPEAIHAHMNFLADDLLEGRGTGARGYELAAKYVAAQLEAYGLEAGGTDGTYFQQMQFRRATVVPDRTSMTIRDSASSRTLAFGKDFAVRADPTRAEANVVAPVVIVGYGITAPEFGIDDFVGVDVKDKIVAVIGGAPDTLPDVPRAIYSSLQTKLETAAAHGAIGVWTLRTAPGPVPKPNPLTLWKGKDGLSNGTPEQIRIAGAVSRDVTASLLSKSGYTVEQFEAAVKNRTFKPIDAVITSATTAVVEYTDFTAPNVVGICRGSDASLKNEYVVFSAHLDHLGIGEPVNGDSIYNGALDNASGIAVLLEMARVCASSPRAQRSILFLAVTGEELGLLGSDYFATYPTVAREKIVADVNGDGGNVLFNTHDLVAIGADHSTLHKQVEEVAHALHLEVISDPQPDQVLFVRSDQYSFVRQGIPAVWATPGRDTGDPSKDGLKIFQEFQAKYYHKPNDDMHQMFDFNAGAAWARLQFFLAYAIANEASRPQWNPDSFLGKRFGGHR